MIHFGDESFNDFIDLDAKTFYDRIKKNLIMYLKQVMYPGFIYA